MTKLSAATRFALAPFRFDVTPPVGHPLLAGLVPPASGHDDPLEAIGYVLLGAGNPIVVCVLDWAGLLNEAHLRWRETLAKAAGTTPERVAVHCVHQHNAPFVCPESDAVARRHGLPEMFDAGFHDACLKRAAKAVRNAMARTIGVTHVAHGRAEVHEVASNRRVARDSTGRVIAMRKSSCEDAALRALPEGTIDPWLQTVTFYAEEKKILSAHYYATHPMSYYRDGRVSSDFCGLARRRRKRDEPGCTHLYFTGCAGNVAAGKYNLGTPADRAALTDRVYDAMRRSETDLQPERLQTVEWRCEPLFPEPQQPLHPEELESTLARESAAAVERLLCAFRAGWLHRLERKQPLVLSCLRLNGISILHLPGEMFVEYQLRARAMLPGRPVAVAAYGDDGLWYVPTREEYPCGGYEVEQAFSSATVDPMLTAAMRRLLLDR